MENEPQTELGLLDKTAFLHVLVTKERKPAYIPLPTNLGPKCKSRLLYFPLNFGELTIDGLVDTGALSSAFPEADLRKNCLLAPQSKVKVVPATTFQIKVANGQLETSKSTVEIKFGVGDIDFHEIFIMETSTGNCTDVPPNHTVSDIRQGHHNFPHLSMQFKTTDINTPTFWNRYSTQNI